MTARTVESHLPSATLLLRIASSPIAHNPSWAFAGGKGIFRQECRDVVVWTGQLPDASYIPYPLPDRLDLA
jgi:hypothetical protein